MEINGVKIDWLGHDGFLITCLQNKRIAIDPFNINDKLEKVDIILITHSHYDRCSIKDIEKLVKKGTIIVTPMDAQSKITRIEGIEMQVIEVGDILDFGAIKIEGVPAYNINKLFHPKKEGWLGYLIKTNNVVIYHAGDTDKIPEMEKLTGYGKHGVQFIVLLPVSGTQTMTADEAAETAKMLNPNLAIPMHYGSGVVGTLDDAQKFFNRCKELGVPAQILDKVQ